MLAGAAATSSLVGVIHQQNTPEVKIPMEFGDELAFVTIDRGF